MGTWSEHISAEELGRYAVASQAEAERFKAAGGPARLAALIPSEPSGEIMRPSTAVLEQVLGMTSGIIKSVEDRMRGS